MKHSTILRLLALPAALLSLMAFSTPSYADCAGYRLSAFGGDAGFRVMSNPRDFRKVSNGSVRGEICGKRVTIELAKRKPGTHVSMEIAGREYTFGQGDRGDKHENNWFRRYFTVDLPGKRPYKSHSDAYYDHGYNNDQYYSGGYQGHGYSSKPYKHGQGHYGGGYQDDYYHGGSKRHGYSNHGHNGHGYNDHGWRSQQIPRYRIGTKNHKRAHRKGIPHVHYGDGYAWH